MTRRTRIARRTWALLLVAGSIVPAASANAGASPLAIPAPRSGGPEALAVDRHGNAIVVWGTDVLHRSPPGALTVDVVRAHAAKRIRWQRGNALILDSARSAVGDLDLLVQEGTRSPFRLALIEVRQDGTVRRVWSTKVHVAANGGSSHAMVARRGARVAVTWLASPSSRARAPVRLRMAIGRIGERLRTHAVDGVLPASVDNHLGFVHDGDLAIGAAGEPIIALTTTRARRRTLVLASLTAVGDVRTRQLSPGVEGLVTMRATPSGRVGVLVEDTGIQDDFGECIEDFTQRRLSAFVREPGSPRFGPLQLVATPPTSCYHTEGRLLAAGNRLALVWGTVPEGPPELPTVQVAWADAGQPFTPPATVATGMVLRGATLGATGLNVVMINAPAINPNAGPLFSERIAPEGPGPLQPLDGADVFQVLTDSDPSGPVATAWRRGFGGELLLSVQPG